MNSDHTRPTELRCRACGAHGESQRLADIIGKTYQVVVACASCGSSLVVLSRN